jgi:hypothetical protein
MSPLKRKAAAALTYGVIRVEDILSPQHRGGPGIAFSFAQAGRIFTG